jgi:hypothetical protein
MIPLYCPGTEQTLNPLSTIVNARALYYSPSFSFRGSGDIDRGSGCQQDPVWSSTVLWCVRGAHFHHKCAPFLHRIATLDPPRSCTVLRCVRLLIFITNVRHSCTELPLWIRRGVVRCSGACAVLIFSFPDRPWLPLAVPLLGCPWLSQAAPGLLLAAPGCSWLLLVASGRC